MAQRKNFKKQGVDSFFKDIPEKKTKKKVAAKTEKSKVVRATFYITTDRLEKIKAISWYRRDPIKNTIHTALDNYFSNVKKECDESIKAYRKTEK